jgi:hypothetical protein
LDAQRLPVALTQRRDGVHIGKHGGVVPLRVGEGAGDDVLGHPVEAVREVAVTLGPRGREPVVGPAPEQERPRLVGLVELVVVHGLVGLDVEGPPRVAERLVAAGGLHDAVE